VSAFAERIAKRSRVVTVVALAGLAMLSWVYILSGAGLPTMSGMAASPSFATITFMWWVMMIGMMIPAASPTILLYAHVHRHSNGAKSPPPTAAFLAGYLAYDMIHYALHHHTPRTRAGKWLRELHMRHHFQDDERGFGISAPYWDRVFGTMHVRRGR